MPELSGVLVINKEKGYTSHDAVAYIRRTLKCKTGHTGTLDPMATGVLPICLGKATKILRYLVDDNKLYRTVLKLGVITDTQDTSGAIMEERACSVNRDEVMSCLHSFVGKQKQLPPMYSAIKQNGQKLYELARKGVTVERGQRDITIDSINDVNFIAGDLFEFSVSCSKGTYIRTLCHDIGIKLGCGAAMDSLCRLKSGVFSLDESVTLGEFKIQAEKNTYQSVIRHIDEFLMFDKMYMIDSAEKYIRNGNAISAEFIDYTVTNNYNIQYGDRVLVYDAGKILAGVYLYLNDSLKPETMLRT